MLQSHSRVVICPHHRFAYILFQKTSQLESDYTDDPIFPETFTRGGYRTHQIEGTME